MKKNIKKIIKTITPKSVWQLIRIYLHQPTELEQKILKYLKSLPKADKTPEIKSVYRFIKHNCELPIFPQKFIEKYRGKENDIEVFSDEKNGLKYVWHDGKRLYFKRKNIFSEKETTEEDVKRYYNWISLEQDLESPHCYETADFHVEQGDVVVDAGTAEGNFALDVIEKVKKIYLFEVDKDWIEALEATFEPWKEKVTIVNKYVSDKTDDAQNTVALDDYFKNEKIDFLKADIEGAETELLAGATNIFTKHLKKAILCTYHKHDDALVIENILKEHGFTTGFSKGFMIFYFDQLQPPYLRRCLIRAKSDRSSLETI